MLAMKRDLPRAVVVIGLACIAASVAGCDPAYRPLPIVVSVQAGGSLEITVPACKGESIGVLGVFSSEQAGGDVLLYEPWDRAPSDQELKFSVSVASLKAGSIADYHVREYRAFDPANVSLDDYGHFTARVGWRYTSFDLGDAAGLEPKTYVFDGINVTPKAVTSDEAQARLNGHCEND